MCVGVSAIFYIQEVVHLCYCVYCSFQELQAKQAAQKLADGLSFKTENYNPEGGPLASYREEHDDGAQLSSEED